MAQVQGINTESVIKLTGFCRSTIVDSKEHLTYTDFAGVQITPKEKQYFWCTGEAYIGLIQYINTTTIQHQIITAVANNTLRIGSVSFVDTVDQASITICGDSPNQTINFQTPRGRAGKDGKDGKNGEDGKPGVNGKPGQNGNDGLNGKPGQPGRDGITPKFILEDNGDLYVEYTTEEY